MPFRWNAYIACLESYAKNPKIMELPPKENPTTKYQIVLMQLERKYGERIVARYFQLRQKYCLPTGYRTNDSDAVWLWSQAAGEDLFPFFKSFGYEVDKEKVAVPAAGTPRLHGPRDREPDE
jgi:hypothetical protein